MYPGPDNILRCSACGALMCQSTYLSYNTFRAQLWSDGYNSAYAWADPDWTLCPGCKMGLYVRELEVVGEAEDGYPVHPAERDRDRELYTVRSAMKDRSLRMTLRRWRGKAPGIGQLKKREAELWARVFKWDPKEFPYLESLPPIDRLEPSDYEHLLTNGAHGADERKEISLRIEYWWALNAPVRKHAELRPDPLEAHHRNLLRLEELLLKKGSPDVRIVAIRMELGRFEEAGDYLSRLPENEKTKEQRQKFNSAMEQRIDRVFRIY